MKMRLLPVLLFLITSVAECLMLRKFYVPKIKLCDEDALLKCEYDLGRDRLYTVKWYKDNEEFFRFVPRYKPPTKVHPVEGVYVDESKSTDMQVQLRSLTVKSTGVYRCEVSAEAPSFASVTGGGRMTVVYLPKEQPKITGNLRDEYEVGDVLDLNCTSAKSFPPTKLSWYINDSPVDVPWSISLHPAPLETTATMTTRSPHYHSHNLQPYSPTTTSIATTTSSQYYLMITSLRLQLQLQQHHFGPKGTAKVRCVARMSTLFWQDGDEKILGHHKHGNGNNGKSSMNDHGDDDISHEVTSSGYGHEEDGEDYHDHDHLEDHEHGHDESYRNRRKHSQREQHHHRRHNNNNVRTSHHQNQNHHHDHTAIHLEEEEYEGYYGTVSGYQNEALVLVRGGCSKTKMSRVIVYGCLVVNLILASLKPRLLLFFQV